MASSDSAALIAYWESKSRKHWLALYRTPDGYRYEAVGATGRFPAASEAEAIAMMERRLSDFQPDRAKTLMRRVDLEMESSKRPKCSICRKEAGSGKDCDRCASYRRMKQERDNPTPKQRAAKEAWGREFQSQQEAERSLEAARLARFSGRRITVGLVSCGKSKLDHPAPAKELYTSTLFRAARQYAERCCDDWVILSAGHGVLLPEQIVAPYERAMEQLSLSEKEQWGRTVSSFLTQHYRGLDVRYEGLAGSEYSDYLLWDVERPLHGYGIGLRIKRLQEMLRDCRTFLPTSQLRGNEYLERIITRSMESVSATDRTKVTDYWQKRRGMFRYLAVLTVECYRNGRTQRETEGWALSRFEKELSLRAPSQRVEHEAWVRHRAAMLQGMIRSIWRFAADADLRPK